jgi:hypothetical protein
VQDQLKVSEGWVRCGQCHEVFHGIEQLFDLESDPTIAARRAAARSQGTSTEDSVPGFAPTRTPPINVVRRPVAPPPPPRAPAPAPATVVAPLQPPPPASPARRFSPPPVRPMPAVAETPSTPKPSPDILVTRGQVLPPVVPARPPGEDVAPTVDFDFDDGAGLAGVLVDDATEDAGPAPSLPPAPMPAAAPPPFTTSSPAPVTAPIPAPVTAPPPAPVAAASPDPVEALLPAPVAAPPQVARRASRRVPPPAAPQDAVSTLPSRLVDDEGPETLASMLPEAPGDWPPRKRRSSRSSGKTRTPLPGDAKGSARDQHGARPDTPAPAPADHPRFLREARRAAFWDAPAMRAVLLVAAIALSLGALAQVALPLRDTIAARWPVTAPVLDIACEQAGCTLQAPRALASLALDGSSLTRTETDHVLLFSADLRNRAAWPVRMPAFDLKFTDIGGQVVARRVFEPADLGIGSVSLAPDTELHVHARLKLDGIDVVGFQAEVFYP